MLHIASFAPSEETIYTCDFLSVFELKSLCRGLKIELVSSLSDNAEIRSNAARIIFQILSTLESLDVCFNLTILNS